jgi:hypothetical protein
MVASLEGGDFDALVDLDGATYVKLPDLGYAFA